MPSAFFVAWHRLEKAGLSSVFYFSGAILTPRSVCTNSSDPKYSGHHPTKQGLGKKLGNVGQLEERLA
jgi:hypothetical protein